MALDHTLPAGWLRDEIARSMDLIERRHALVEGGDGLSDTQVETLRECVDRALAGEDLRCTPSRARKDG